MLPAPPDGVHPGRLGAIVLGRVIIGDIAATLVDLATRELVRVEPTDGDGWRLNSLAQSAPRHRLSSLLHYEEALLAGLSEARTLQELATSLPHTLDKTRSAIVHDAVHRGWLKHLQHDERTEQGEAVTERIQAFRRSLRHLKGAEGADAFTGPLLSFALHFGLAEPSWDPLVPFARDFVASFAGLPGWQRPEYKMPEVDIDAINRPTIDEQIMGVGGAGLAWLL
jgi:hypothetical protein